MDLVRRRFPEALVSIFYKKHVGEDLAEHDVRCLIEA